MTARTAELKDYITRAMRDVPGWFEPLDAWALVAVDDLQREMGVRGNVVEVGVFSGKSAVLLGYLTSDSEQLLCIDLFGNPPERPEQLEEQARWYKYTGNSGLERFEATFAHFHGGPPLTFVGDSAAALRRDGVGPVRVAHIDGSHQYESVRGDISGVLATAVADVCVVVDDITTPHAPGVAAATWEAVLDGRLVPLAITLQKLYLTVPGSRLSAEGLAIACEARGLATKQVHDVRGHRVLELSTTASADTPGRSFLNRIRSSLLASLGRVG